MHHSLVLCRTLIFIKLSAHYEITVITSKRQQKPTHQRQNRAGSKAIIILLRSEYSYLMQLARC